VARGLTLWHAAPLLLATAACVAGEVAVPPTSNPVQQRMDYASNTAKTILELQPFRDQARTPLRRADGTMGTATLTDLNPAIHSWYLLTLQWPGEPSSGYHLQTPHAQPLRLLSGEAGSLQVADASGVPCTLWTSRGSTALDQARRSGLPYAALCDGRLYLLNMVAGQKTSLERVTDFLRDNVWGGEKVISFVKETLYQDSFLEKRGNGSAPAAAPAGASSQGSPQAQWPLTGPWMASTRRTWRSIGRQRAISCVRGSGTRCATSPASSSVPLRRRTWSSACCGAASAA
jgi:hypothetical protein